MFDRLRYFGGFINLPLNTSWHGINVLSILEFCLVAMLFCAILTLGFAVRRDRSRLISWALAGTMMFSTAALAANTALSGLTASGALAGANLIYVVQSVGSGGVKATMTQVATFINSLFSGDATVASGGAVTLATVNANVGSFGTATTCVSITVNAKGLITAASAATCTPAVGSVTGFGTGVATALGVNIGTAGSVIVNGGAGGTPSSLTLTNASGLPIAGTSGYGTGVATALANAVNGAGGFITVGNAVSSITPGAGQVSGITASCTQTAITTSGTISAAQCINPQVGTSYAIADTDRAKLVTFSNAASVAVTLAQAGTGSAFANGWFTDVINNGAGTVTITPTTSTIKGVATLVLTTGQGARIYSDGTNYQVNSGSGTGGSGISSLTPGAALVSSTTSACSQSAITTSGTLSGGECLNAQAGTSYAIQDSDRGKLITGTNAASQAYSIAQAGASTTFQSGWFTRVQNKGAGPLVITPTTSTICGASTLTLYPSQTQKITSDGTNYQCDGGTTGSLAVSSQVGANYAFVSSNFGQLVDLSNASPQTPTIPQAGTTGFPSGWYVGACNQGAGIQTITPATSTIGGAASYPLGAGSAKSPTCVTIVSDGTNYQVVPEALVGTVTGALKASAGGVLSQAACADLSNGTALCSTTPGTGVATAAAANLSAAGGLTSTIASGTAALGTGAITNGTCATAVTVAATNVATTDIVTAGFAADPTATTGYLPTAMLTIVPYPTSGNVNFKVCNLSGSSITPSAVTINWRVTR